MNRHPTATGLIIEQSASLREFPLADILSLASGLALPGVDAGGIQALVGYVTEGAPDAATAALHGAEVRACLAEQLPFLQHLDLTRLHRAVRADRAHVADHIALWYDSQTRRYGKAHYVMPLSRWRRRRNSHKL